VAYTVSLDLNQTPAYIARPQTRGKYIIQCACLLPSIHWFSLCLRTDELPGWINRKAV